MTGDLENEAALDHPGNAVVKCLTVGFDPWEAHELGGDDNTTNTNSVTINRIELRIISTCPSPRFRESSSTARTLFLRSALRACPLELPLRAPLSPAKRTAQAQSVTDVQKRTCITLWIVALSD